MLQVITSLGPAKPQRSLNNNISSTHSDTDHCQLVAGSNGSAGSPPHRLCLETSFTSFQPKLVDKSSLDSKHLPWEFASLVRNGSGSGIHSSVDLIHDDWFGLAPLATPESLSEVSSISSRASTLGHPATDKKKHASVSFVDIPVKHHFLREDSKHSNNTPVKSWKSHLKQNFFSAENFTCVKSKTKSDSSPENGSLINEDDDKFYSAESVSNDQGRSNNKENEQLEEENSSESSPLLSSLHLLTDEKFQNLFKSQIVVNTDDSISSGSFKSVSSDIRDQSTSMDSVTVNAEVHRSEDKISWSENSNLLEDIERSLNFNSNDSPGGCKTNSPGNFSVKTESVCEVTIKPELSKTSGGGKNKYIYPILSVGKGESSV